MLQTVKRLEGEAWESYQDLETLHMQDTTGLHSWREPGYFTLVALACPRTHACGAARIVLHTAAQTCKPSCPAWGSPSEQQPARCCARPLLRSKAWQTFRSCCVGGGSASRLRSVKTGSGGARVWDCCSWLLPSRLTCAYLKPCKVCSRPIATFCRAALHHQRPEDRPFTSPACAFAVYTQRTVEVRAQPCSR